MRHVKTTVKLGVAAAALSIQLTGCATIHHRSTQRLPISSDPAGADVTVRCGQATLFSGQTPATVPIRRRATQCAVSLQKEGYLPQTFELKRKTSGWFWSNLLIPPVLGALGAAGHEDCSSPGGFFCNDASDDAFGFTVLGLIPAGIGMGIDAITGSMYRQVPPRIEVTLQPR